MLIAPQQDLNEARTPPGFAEMTRLWARIGFLSFGGPAGQIALMHREVVEERRWISEPRFLHALNYCMLLPGPEAQQLAIYIGWLLHGVRGGIVAGTLFVLPGFLVIVGLSCAYALYSETAWLESVFFGLKAAVLAIVVEAVIRLGRRSLKTPFVRLTACLAFAALFLFNVPFPLVILAAGVAGYVAVQRQPAMVEDALGTDTAGEDIAVRAPPSVGVTVRLLAIGVFLWAAPAVLAGLVFSFDTVFTGIALFFSKMAIVTFGGAYAVLAYVAQQAVETYHWLKPGEMLDGLALAETTPGPLVLVLSFVGFMGAYRQPMGLDPLVSGVLGATLSAWVTFVPCFLWIFLGAPYIEKVRANRALAGGLATISAAVTGVLLNLAIWFALHVLFADIVRIEAGPLSMPAPVWSTLQPLNVALALLAAVLLFRLRRSVVTTLGICAACGWLIGAFSR